MFTELHSESNQAVPGRRVGGEDNWCPTPNAPTVYEIALRVFMAIRDG